MVSDPKILGEAEDLPQSASFDGRPLLGFDCLVAPINKNEGFKNAMSENSPLPRDVHELLGGKNVPPSVAPPLPDLLRQILEGKQIQNKTIEDFLQRNKSLKRYSSSFRLLWTVLENSGINPPNANSDQIADAIVQVFRFSPAQARNAYSAVLLLPGIPGVFVFTPFRPLLKENGKKYRKIWCILGSNAPAAGHDGNSIRCAFSPQQFATMAPAPDRLLQVALPLSFA